MSDLSDILKDIAGDLSTTKASSRKTIRPLLAEDKANRCTCGHYKRYHDVVFNGILLCRYKCGCKGFKLKVSVQKENKQDASTL